MFNHSVEKLVDNMVVADQTKFVERMLASNFGPSYDDIQWPSPDSDDESDDDDYYPEIYYWKLINPYYSDIIEGKAPNYGMAYCEFWGELWLGVTNTNALTQWEYLKGLCKEEEKEEAENKKIELCEYCDNPLYCLSCFGDECH